MGTADTPDPFGIFHALLAREERQAATTKVYDRSEKELELKCAE